MWSATSKLNLGFVCSLLVPVSPKTMARGLLSRSCHVLEELDYLSGGSEKELVQLIYHRLDSSDHVFHPLSAACEFSQVYAIVCSDDHRFFSRAMFRDFLHMEVVHILLPPCLGIGSVEEGGASKC